MGISQRIKDANAKHVVSDYLQHSVVLTSKDQLVNVLYDLTNEAECVPEEVSSAFNRLSAHDMWDVLETLACLGKLASKRQFEEQSKVISCPQCHLSALKYLTGPNAGSVICPNCD